MTCTPNALDTLLDDTIILLNNQEIGIMSHEIISEFVEIVKLLVSVLKLYPNQKKYDVCVDALKEMGNLSDDSPDSLHAAIDLLGKVHDELTFAKEQS